MKLVLHLGWPNFLKEEIEGDCVRYATLVTVVFEIIDCRPRKVYQCDYLQN